MKGKQGFASMDASKQRNIARSGGKAAHEKGTAHEWTSTTAQAAGRKGGMASAAARRAMREATQQTPTPSV